jgi:hypothetical protein
MPSVLRPNLKFRASSVKSGNSLSIFLYCDPSAGCLNITSLLRPSLCHHNNLVCSLFLNKRFNRGIIGAYPITLAGTLFLGCSPSTSPGSAPLILYRKALHTGHAFKFSYSSLRKGVVRGGASWPHHRVARPGAGPRPLGVSLARGPLRLVFRLLEALVNIRRFGFCFVQFREYFLCNFS